MASEGIPLNLINKGEIVKVPNGTMGQELEVGTISAVRTPLEETVYAVASRVLGNDEVLLEGVFGSGHLPKDYFIPADTSVVKVIPDKLLPSGL